MITNHGSTEIGSGKMDERAPSCIRTESPLSHYDLM